MHQEMLQLEPRKLARRTDPPTSHEAAQEVCRSGRAQAHAAIVLAIVQAHPGLTYREIATHCELDAVEVMRRLNDLERADRVEKGPIRQCSSNHHRMATWNPKSEL